MPDSRLQGGPLSPSSLGKFELLGHLATGGMGEIFLARQRGPAGFSKLLIIKRILPHLASDSAFVQMFLNEARLAARLLHPNIVQVYELGAEGGEYFMAMEYVRGHNLRSVLRSLRERSAQVDPSLAAQIAAQALEGLHYAHTLADASGAPLSIVHRDVSPDNVLLSADGGVKLIDFGIAKGAEATVGERTEVKGKLAYMAPEQLNGERVDGRADVYSVGCILHELLAGAPRFRGTGGAAVAEVQEGRAAPLAELRPDLPPALVEVVERAVQVRRELRFQSAREMAQALEEHLAKSGRVVGPGALSEWLAQVMGGAVPAAFLRAEADGRPGATAPGKGARDPSAPRHPTGAPNPQLRSDAPSQETKVGPRESLVSADATRALELPRPPDPAPVLAPPPAAAAAPRPMKGDRRRWSAWAGSGAAALAIAFALGASRESAPPAAGAPATAPASTDGPAQLEAAPPASGSPVAPGVAMAPVGAPGDAASQGGNAGAPETGGGDAGPRGDEAKQERLSARPAAAPESAAAPPAAAHRRRRGSGKVTVLSQPWSVVFWSQQELGITPLIEPIEMPSGRQVLVLRNPQLHLEKRIAVDVPAGGAVEVKAVLDSP